MSSSDQDSDTEQLHSMSEINFVGKGRRLDSQRDANEITQKIEGCSNLATLRLDGVILGEEAAQAIGESLGNHPEFKRALWNNVLSGELNADEIPDVFRLLSSGIMAAGAQLTELDLSDKVVGQNRIEGFADLLKSRSCYRLQTLKLSNNRLGVDGGKMLAECLLECHNNSCNTGTPLELRVFSCDGAQLGNDGTAALAEVFKVMKSLEEVSMPGNKITLEGITALTDAFAQNPNLRSIDIGDNAIQAEGVSQIAKVLSRLEKLEELKCGGCLLGDAGAVELAKGIADIPRLKRLVLTSNDLTVSGARAIVNVMQNKPSLERLDLNGNHLGEQGIAEIQDLMRDMDKQDLLGSFSQDEVVSSDSEEDEENISIQAQPSQNTSDVGSLADQLAQATVDEKTLLDFSGSGLKLNSGADAEEITRKIDSCRGLNALRLEGNTLGVEAAKAIGDSLAKHPEFQRALWSDMFTGRLKSEIPGALRHLGTGIMNAGASLTELDLSDNAFGPNGMEGLTDLLKSSSCYRLQALKLNNNGLGIHGGKMLADCLLECHKRGQQAGTPLQLRVFISGRGRLENDGAKALAEAFKVMGSLEEVSMPQNGINPKGIAALADAFAQNPNLRYINMNDNTFTAAGARSMAEALPHLTKLEEINFGDCLVRNAGAEVLAQALKDGHQRLKRLVLSFNEIKESGANAIAYAVADKPALEKLDLDGNQLGEDGIEIVRATMEGVDKLDILGSFSDDEGLDSEEEEDEEEEEEEDEEEEEEDAEEREASRDNGAGREVSHVTDVTLTPTQDKTVTTQDFLLFPSPRKLKALGSHRVDDIVKYIEEDPSDVDRAVEVFMKVSCIVEADDTETTKAACDCADAIFRTMLRSADTSPPGVVANTILVHLGLIKSEDKKFKPVSQPEGVLLVLKHVVQQDYFLKSMRDILQIFISRPHPALIDCHRSRQNLLDALAKR